MNSMLVSAITPTGATSMTGVTPVRAAATGATEAGDFSSMLSQFAGNALATVHAGEAAAIKGITGGASTQQVVEAVMAAEQALQAGVAIRDKVVAAYLEISRMAI